MRNNIPAVRFGDEEEDHNINIDYGVYDDALNNENNQEHAVEHERNNNLVAGRRVQQMIIRNHFRIDN